MNMKEKYLEKILKSITLIFLMIGTLMSLSGFSFMFEDVEASNINTNNGIQMPEMISIKDIEDINFRKYNPSREDYIVQTKKHIIARKKAEEERSKYWITHVKLTAYCSCYYCSEQWGTKTSTGKRCISGRTIAVDPNIIPYGSIVEIDGHKYVAEDCGGGVNGHHIDIYVDSHAETHLPQYNKKWHKIKVYYKK